MITIAGVSIVGQDGIVYSLPAPNRHPHIFWDYYNKNGKVLLCKEQGFYTNEGIYLNRYDAFKVATAAGQITVKTGNPASEELFSEDMW